MRALIRILIGLGLMALIFVPFLLWPLYTAATWGTVGTTGIMLYGCYCIGDATVDWLRNWKKHV